MEPFWNRLHRRVDYGKATLSPPFYSSLLLMVWQLF
jgi:hypothetical protein